MVLFSALHNPIATTSLDYMYLHVPSVPGTRQYIISHMLHKGKDGICQVIHKKYNKLSVTA